MFGDDPQALPQLVGIDDLTRCPAPTQLLQVEERVGTRPPLQVGQQAVPALGVYPGLRQVLGEQRRAGRHLGRGREEVGRLQSRLEGTVAPDDLVEEVLHTLERREQGGLGGAFHRVTVQPADEHPVRVVDAHLPAEDLRRLARLRLGTLRGLVHADVAEHPVGERPGQPQPVPAERQVGRLLGTADHVAGDAHHLEATVQHQRMHVQAVATQGLRQEHLADRLAGTGPDRPQRPERRAEVDSGLGLGPVVGRHVSRRQASCHLVQVDPPGRFRHRGARQYPTLDM